LGAGAPSVGSFRLVARPPFFGLGCSVVFFFLGAGASSVGTALGVGALVFLPDLLCSPLVW